MPQSDGVAPAAEPCRHHPDHACAHQHGHKEAAAPVDPTALVSARGLGISRHGRDLLIDVNLDIREREIVTLIGPNGAGKTTLVRVLLGLEKPDRLYQFYPLPRSPRAGPVAPYEVTMKTVSVVIEEIAYAPLNAEAGVLMEIPPLAHTFRGSIFLHALRSPDPA